MTKSSSHMQLKSGKITQMPTKPRKQDLTPGARQVLDEIRREVHSQIRWYRPSSQHNRHKNQERRVELQFVTAAQEIAYRGY